MLKLSRLQIFPLAGLVCLMGFVSLVAVDVARADLGAFPDELTPPEPPPVPETMGPYRLEYSESEDAARSRIVLPVSLVTPQAFGWDESIDFGAEFGSDSGSGPLLAGGSATARTVLAGLFLSAAAVCLVLMSRYRRAANIMAMLAIFAAGAWTATALSHGTQQAQAAEAVPAVQVKLDDDERVMIQFTDQGNAVQFIRAARHAQ